MALNSLLFCFFAVLKLLGFCGVIILSPDVLLYFSSVFHQRTVGHVDIPHHICVTRLIVSAVDLRRGFAGSGVAHSGNNLGQVVHAHVPLSPSSIIWYRSKGGDAPRLGR